MEQEYIFPFIYLVSDDGFRASWVDFQNKDHTCLCSTLTVSQKATL